ncbi:hypothetical protein T11_4439 [Trichinella zimbabwensis]|uniref:Uncharacterized protein n=1 Tax=Trichinella zimbabwensis TaxID=268475 RepID=A0A0V1DZW0_9BILA|nr:hypothetical protein T11_4439 [Trichinella zimbabwensis]
MNSGEKKFRNKGECEKQRLDLTICKRNLCNI